jgi:hypothetical protein
MKKKLKISVYGIIFFFFGKDLNSCVFELENLKVVLNHIICQKTCAVQHVRVKRSIYHIHYTGIYVAPAPLN